MSSLPASYTSTTGYQVSGADLSLWYTHIKFQFVLLTEADVDLTNSDSDMDFTVDLTQEAVVPLTADRVDNDTTAKPAADQVDTDATVKPAAADQAADVDLISPVQSPHREKTKEKGEILRSDNLRH